VDEHIVALLTSNKAEALLSVEELHGSCSQSTLSSLRASPCDSLANEPTG
jgi:hypothetical protein